ncbi:MAG: GTP cyclohydrolase I FolE [Lacisediminihabitans sp.]
MSLTISPEQHLADREAPLLTIVERVPTVNLAKAQLAVADLLTALGRDVSSDHLADTPRRVAASLLEMLTPREFTMTTFPNDEGYEELVLVRDIPFHSLCEHHLLPFRGVAHVGYIPGQRILGISKLARVVEMFASDLQVQERLTKQVADYLQEHLDARAVGVVIEAEHLCMSLRGVQSAGATTVTSTFLGDLAEDAALRDRFFMSGPRLATATHTA